MARPGPRAARPVQGSGGRDPVDKRIWVHFGVKRTGRGINFVQIFVSKDNWVSNISQTLIGVVTSA